MGGGFNSYGEYVPPNYYSRRPDELPTSSITVPAPVEASPITSYNNLLTTGGLNVPLSHTRDVMFDKDSDGFSVPIAGGIPELKFDDDEEGLIENSANIPDQKTLELEMALEARKQKARVIRLQKILVANGMMEDEGEKTFDGVIGAKTNAAIKRVKEIQKALGVKADGIIGKNTLKAAMKRGISIADLARHNKASTIKDQVMAMDVIDTKGPELAAMGFRKGGILQYQSGGVVSAPVGSRTYTGGTGSEAARARAKRLHGYTSVMDTYGRRDPEEVKVVQRELGLKEDGIEGPKTKAALERAIWNARPYKDTIDRPVMPLRNN